VDPIVVFATAWLLLPILFLILWLRARGAKNQAEKQITEAEATVEALKEKYAPITSVEDEVSTLRDTATEIKKQIEETRSSYSEKRATLKKLEQQVAIYDEKLSFAELGVYEPHFEFNDADEYKQEIIRNRERQKTMISAKTSTLCPTDWQVDGSRTRGQTMINSLQQRMRSRDCKHALEQRQRNGEAYHQRGQANRQSQRVHEAAYQ
jgi:peptidoglycan hydrolase CwlO-like protein